MKTLKVITISLFAVFSSLTAKAQQFQPFEFSPTPFIGTWQAVDGDMTYTMVISRRVVNYPRVFYGDVLYFRLIYSQNGTIIRDTRIPEKTYATNGWIETQNRVDFGVSDLVLKYDRDVIFTINGDTATWVMRLGTREVLMTRRNGTPDIPANLTFIKISDETDDDSDDDDEPNPPVRPPVQPADDGIFVKP